jgi:hypothetical protein
MVRARPHQREGASSDFAGNIKSFIHRKQLLTAPRIIQFILLSPLNILRAIAEIQSYSSISFRFPHRDMQHRTNKGLVFR